MSKFHERLREALSIAKMTQSELSRKTGIPKSAISQYCAGTFAPKKDRVQVIAKALNISPAWLNGDDGSGAEGAAQPTWRDQMMHTFLSRG